MTATLAHNVKMQIYDQLTSNDKQTVLLSAGLPVGRAATLAMGGSADFWAGLINQGTECSPQTWQSFPKIWQLMCGASTTHNTVANINVPFETDMIFSLNLHKLITFDEAQHMRHHIVKFLPENSNNYQQLCDADYFHSTMSIFNSFVNLMISVKDVADAIESIGKTSVANQLRNLVGVKSTYNQSFTGSSNATSAKGATSASSVASLQKEKDQSNPFSSLPNKTEKSQTLGQIVTDNNDMNYFNICRILTKSGDWEQWMEDNNLIRTVQIEQFVADIKERQVKEGSKFNVAHAIFTSVIAIPEWFNKPLTEFLNELKKNKSLCSAVDEWLEDISPKDPTTDDSGVGIRKELRALLSPVFRDTGRLKNALDALVDPERFDLMFLSDLKDISAQELVDSRCFNNREARTIVELSKTL